VVETAHIAYTEELS